MYAKRRGVYDAIVIGSGCVERLVADAVNASFNGARRWTIGRAAVLTEAQDGIKPDSCRWRIEWQADVGRRTSAPGRRQRSRRARATWIESAPAAMHASMGGVSPQWMRLADPTTTWSKTLPSARNARRM